MPTLEQIFPNHRVLTSDSGVAVTTIDIDQYSEWTIQHVSTYKGDGEDDVRQAILKAKRDGALYGGRFSVCEKCGGFTPTSIVVPEEGHPQVGCSLCKTPFADDCASIMAFTVSVGLTKEECRAAIREVLYRDRAGK